MSESAIVALSLLAFGAVLAAALWYVAGRVEGRVAAARGWTEVPGVITAARLRNYGKGRFAPDVTYTYSVGGKDFTGRRIQFGTFEGGKAEAEAFLAEHPVGTAVSPRYDPARHDFSVLRPTGNPGSYRASALWVGGVFGVLAVVLYFIT